MVAFWPRTKPVRVMLVFFAAWIASVVGAETAAISSIPARAAFIISSRLTRPERTAAEPFVGIDCRRHEPITLSKALCRPMSSQRAIILLL